MHSVFACSLHAVLLQHPPRLHARLSCSPASFCLRRQRFSLTAFLAVSLSLSTHPTPQHHPHHQQQLNLDGLKSATLLSWLKDAGFFAASTTTDGNATVINLTHPKGH